MSAPFDYPGLIPYIAVIDSVAAMEFYKTAFGAVERFRLTNPENGKIANCEFTIGGQLMMMSEEFPGFLTSPATLGGATTKFCLMVENADEACARAVAAGATILQPPDDQFYGYRAGCVRDPFGHEWMLQHDVEKLAPEQMQERWAKMTDTCE